MLKRDPNLPDLWKGLEEIFQLIEISFIHAWIVRDMSGQFFEFAFSEGPAFEYRLALMLGASVGVIESSGREVARLFKDPDWSHSKTLWRLVADEKEIKTFINSEKSE